MYHANEEKEQREEEEGLSTISWYQLIAVIALDHDFMTCDMI